ncbi:hypothetical protein BGX34_006710 [Mortierella sp. NVP85]|nr:hypothetical protein BGX34_006710 [Mortierella sp. NVP85]
MSQNWITHLMMGIILLRIQSAVAYMSLFYPMPRGGVLDMVRFWNPALPDEKIDVLPPKPTKCNSQQVSQVRHGGGFCQMSLTYDGGKILPGFALRMARQDPGQRFQL